MAEAKFYTYVHRRADTNEVFYIGKGCGRRAWSSVGRSDFWKRIKAKYGIVVEIVDRFHSETEAFKHEIALIAVHRSAGLRIVNMTNGGEGASGAKRSAETLRKMSEASRGRKMPPESEETRRRKSESAKGRSMSADAIAKTVAFHTGRKRSPKTLERMSEALKGKGVGRVKTADERAKLSAGRRGKTHSEATKLAMSQNRRGKTKKPQSPEHRQKIAEARRAYWERWRNEKLTAALQQTD